MIAKRNPAGVNGGARKDPVGGRNLDVDSINLEHFLDPADRLMLAALREGTFILAAVCRVCGKPLTAKRSRARGIGPACRKRVAK